MKKLQKLKFILVAVNLPRETLDALVGPEHVANTCLRVVEQCANPMPFEDSNKKIRGVLFCGPSRTGKTFAAKAICGEINKRLGTSKYKFLYHIASNFSYGSNAFDNIISEAEALAPCILCIEEIDTLNLQKGMSQQQMRTLGDFLGWMGDGPLETLKSKGVIIIGITNNPEKLDKALLQPGRFDRIVVFDLPSFKHRMEHLEKQLVKFSIDLSETIKYKIIQSTEGKTYADLDNIISCVIEKSKELNQPIKDAFFEDAIDLEIYKIDLPQKDLSVEQLNAVSAYHSGKTLMTKILFPEKIISRATVNPVKKAIEENKKLNEYFEWGGTFSHWQEDELNFGEETKLEKKCKLLLSGLEAQKMLTGDYNYLHATTDRQEAIDTALSIVLKGLKYSNFPENSKKEAVEKAEQLLERYALEVREILEQNKELLLHLDSKLKEQRLLHKEEIEAILNQNSMAAVLRNEENSNQNED